MGLKARPQASGTSLYRGLTIADDRLARLRELCLGMAGAAEKMAWGDPTWRVRGKIFAMQKGNYDGGRPSVWFKGADGAQAMLVSLPGDRFFVPPYVGHKGWVGAWLDLESLNWGELDSLIATSHSIVGRGIGRGVGR